MHQHAQPGQPASAESFPTDPSGLPEANMRWMLVDQTTDAANAAIDWHFTGGMMFSFTVARKEAAR